MIQFLLKGLNKYKIVTVKKRGLQSSIASLIKFLKVIRCKTTNGKKTICHAEYFISYSYKCQSTKDCFLYSTWITRSSTFLVIHVSTVLWFIGKLFPFSFMDILSSFFWLISRNLNEHYYLNEYICSQIYSYMLSNYS